MPDVTIFLKAKDLTAPAWDSMERKGKGALGKITKMLPSVKFAAAGAAGAVAGIGAGAYKSLSMFEDYESALTDMGKVTSESLESINRKIMELPPALGGATEMVQGYYQVISAGVTDPKAALDTLEVSAKAAKAAHVAQSEVIKGLTKVMAGFEGEIENVTEASDLLFAIEKEGQTSFQELIPVVGGLAKLSSDLGVSNEEMGASLATISQTAGSTAEAATQYRATLVALMKPTETMLETVKGLGYESVQAMVKQEGLTGTLKKLKESTGGSAEAMAELFGRQEALLGMSALSSNNFETLTGKVAAMGEKSGATDRAFKEWRKTLAGLKDTAKNALGKVMIQIGKELAPTVADAMEKIGAWMTDNREEIVQYAKNFIKMAKKVVQAVTWIVGALFDAADAAADFYMKAEEAVGKVSNFFTGLYDTVEEALTDIAGFIEKYHPAAIIVRHFKDNWATVQGWLDKIKNAFNSITAKIPFVGSGSPEKPLTDYVEYAKGKVSEIGQVPVTAEVGFTSGGQPLSAAVSAFQHITERTREAAEEEDRFWKQAFSHMTQAQGKIQETSAAFSAAKSTVGKATENVVDAYYASIDEYYRAEWEAVDRLYGVGTFAKETVGQIKWASVDLNKGVGKAVEGAESAVKESSENATGAVAGIRTAIEGLPESRTFDMDVTAALSSIDAVKGALDSIPEVTHKKVVVEHVGSGSPQLPLSDYVDYAKGKVSEIGQVPVTAEVEFTSGGQPLSAAVSAFQAAGFRYSPEQLLSGPAYHAAFGAFKDYTPRPTFGGLYGPLNEMQYEVERLRAENWAAFHSVPRFHGGGLSSHEGLALIRDDEYIVNPEATRRNLRTLEAMNRGESPAQNITFAPTVVINGAGRDARDIARDVDAEQARLWRENRSELKKEMARG